MDIVSVNRRYFFWCINIWALPSKVQKAPRHTARLRLINNPKGVKIRRAPTGAHHWVHSLYSRLPEECPQFAATRCNGCRHPSRLDALSAMAWGNYEGRCFAAPDRIAVCALYRRIKGIIEHCSGTPGRLEASPRVRGNLQPEGRSRSSVRSIPVCTG